MEVKWKCIMVINCMDQVAWQLVCWELVLLGACPVGSLSCWELVLLGACPVGSLSCWKLVLLEACPVGSLSCWEAIQPHRCQCWSHGDVIEAASPCGVGALEGRGGELVDVGSPKWFSCNSPVYARAPGILGDDRHSEIYSSRMTEMESVIMASQCLSSPSCILKCFTDAMKR